MIPEMFYFLGKFNLQLMSIPLKILMMEFIFSHIYSYTTSSETLNPVSKIALAFPEILQGFFKINVLTEFP